MIIGIINEEPGILNERLLIKKLKKTAKEKQLELFPRKKQPPDTILSPKSQSAKTALSQLRGRVNYHSEKGREKGEGGFFPSMQFDPKRSALGSLFEDTTKFPASLWFKQLLMEGVQPFVLNSLALRKPSPPSLRKGFRPDGSNLPWIIAELSKKAPESFQRWLEHVRTALPDIETIVTVEREEDKHCYLKIQYHNGCLIPSWLVSDGTLRLLALTIPAYLTDIEGVYLIEEPENGVHPAAVKTITDSLQSVYGAQVLLATHSPIVLGELSPSNILCFAKTEEGATDIVRGDEHPKLREWRGTPGLETLFASGVLG